MSQSSAAEAWGGTEEFVELSSALSGFSVAELEKTGMAGAYAEFVAARVGAAPCIALRTALAGVPPTPELPGPAVAELPSKLAEEPLALARSLTHLWYTGCWPGPPGSAPTVVSARAYAEGLVWRALGGHAPGTGRPGFGSWSEAPEGAAR
ncbi:hypothetical protein [Streptomyces sp. WAC01280]|uniref:hypothetical protein n=1 Tax=Streptomyces sp. WAC01280 TaxID=2487424 RepID=UPI000F780D67|nr:hypothetical protein [Streptomyces sp. WAC01280]RSS57178.1 hypothetical protein EF909_14255 [Streptomyces sp. WAC01280]